MARLDYERAAKARLAMWPDANMPWYAISVAVAGLLQREIEISKIETVLLENGIRPEGDIVGAVKRLASLRWEKK